MLGGIVRGKTATLRTPTEGDLPAISAWMADMRVRRGGHLWDEPATLATWKERLKEAAKDQSAILWTIEAEGRPVGFARVELSREAPLAELHQLVIDPEMWGHGFGGDAALALHRYLFDYLDRRACVVELPADNETAIRVAAKLGYREFGRGHDVYHRGGMYVDQVSLRFDRSVWDERWSATEREYPGSDLAPGGAPRERPGVGAPAREALLDLDAATPRSARPGDAGSDLAQGKAPR